MLSAEQIEAGLLAFGYACKLTRGLPGDSTRLILLADNLETDHPIIRYSLAVGAASMWLERWDGVRFRLQIKSAVLYPVLVWLQEHNFPRRKVAELRDLEGHRKISK